MGVSPLLLVLSRLHDITMAANSSKKLSKDQLLTPTLLGDQTKSPLTAAQAYWEKRAQKMNENPMIPGQPEPSDPEAPRLA